MPDPTTSPSRRSVLAATVLGLAGGGRRGHQASTPLEDGSSREPELDFRPRVPLAPDEPVRVGVIGVGPMGQQHCKAFADSRSGALTTQVVALSDVCAPRLGAAWEVVSRLQPELEVSTHTSYRELLELDLHGVVIASPVHWHSEMALDALLAGKDVYLEKPIASDLAGALAVERAARVGGSVLQVGTQMIREPKYAAARRLIAEGRIGRLTCAQTSYCRNSLGGEWQYPIDPQVQPEKTLDWEAWCGPLAPEPWDTKVFHRWRRYRKFSTGILGDLLVHVVTPMVWTLDCGWPVRVAATGARLVDLDMEHHDQVNLNVQFEDGTSLVLMGSTCNEQGLETIVRGHRATIHLGGNHCTLTPERIDADAEPVDLRFEGGAVQMAHRRDWVECIRTRGVPMAEAITACKVAAIIELGSRALWEGATFELDPATMRIGRV